MRLVLATREPSQYGLEDLDRYIAYGASPRASLGLVAAGRALALIRGRDYVLPNDIFDVAPEVLRHRLVLSYEALADGVDADAIVRRVLATVVMPRVAPRQFDAGRRHRGRRRGSPAVDGDRRGTFGVTFAATSALGRTESTLRLLELQVNRRLDGLLQGDHLGLVPGAGHRAGRRPRVRRR